MPEDILSESSLLKDMKTEEVIAVCETRSHTEEVKHRLPKKLKFNKLPEVDISPVELIQLQKDDPTLSKIRKLVESGTEKQLTASEGKSIFVLKKGILYRQCKDKHKDEVKHQLVVPQKLRENVMSMAHESLLSAHQGVTRTLTKINAEFFWPLMSEEVKRFVMSCNLCQRCVGVQGKTKAKLGHLPIVGIPFQMVCADLVGPVEPRSSNGYRYMLTIVDMATRYPEAIPLKGISAEEVAEELFRYYCRVGVPQCIHTDRGSQFTSELMAHVNRLCQIRHSKSSAYHAMGNGAVERLNATIKSTLKKLIVEQPKEWDRFVDPLLFALRDSVHEGHGFTPFELVYGRSPRGPMRILRELWTKDEVTEEVRDECSYVEDLQNRIEETCKIAQIELEKSQKRSEKFYNRKAKYRSLEINDQVLLLTPVKTSKMSFSWEGPYVVKGKVGERDYRVEVAPGKVRTYHINMLKKYCNRQASREVPKNPEIQVEPVVEQEVATLVTVVNDGEIDKDEELLELYNGVQKESYKDVKINPDLNSKQKGELVRLLERYKDIFSDVPGRTDLAEHEIKLTANTPVRSKAYPTPYGLQKEIDREIETMLQSGIIERSDSAYAAPLVVVKKADGTNRLCCNYKQLNKLTVFDPEPMMANDDIFVKLSGSKIFSKFDFCKGYWQIPMSEDSKDYTSFICKNGHFRFKVLPFGLINSASSYNRMMRKMLEGLRDLESYVDDVLAHTENWEDYLKTLERFFKRVSEAKLTMKPTKCQLGYLTIDFLGHTLSEGQITPKAESIDKIMDMPRPRNKKQVRSFVGAINYFRKFIPNSAELMKPLTELTKKSAKLQVEWNEELEEAFCKLKEVLSKAPVLKLPDIEGEFLIQTDASDDAMGCVLMQEHNGDKHPVSYASKKFSERERKYSVEERECLAMVWGIQKYNRFLYGKEFIIETDHCGLQYLKTGSIRNARVMRWYLALQNYNFKVRYIRGSENNVADYLSRDQ